RAEFTKQAARIIGDYEDHQLELGQAKSSLASAVDGVLESFMLGSPDDGLLEEIVRDRAALILDGYYAEEISKAGAYTEITEIIENLIRDPEKAKALLRELTEDVKPSPKDSSDKPANKIEFPEGWDPKWGTPPGASPT